MSNKVCLYERGHFTKPVMCSVWIKISISNSSCQYSIVIASVCFNMDRVTTQHTPKCVENGSDSKVSYNCLPNFYQIFCNSVITLKTAFFLNRGLSILF